MTLYIFIVETENGQRAWYAESKQHARDQHLDAFAKEPGEEIVSIHLPNCAYCDERPSTQVLGDPYGEFTYCDKCAEDIAGQATKSAKRLVEGGHFID